MTVEISLEEAGATGRYLARLPGIDALSEMTFQRLPGNRVRINSTRVPEALRGQGIAQLLVERVVADAREQGFTNLPASSYVEAQARRHPDWQDVIELPAR